MNRARQRPLEIRNQTKLCKTQDLNFEKNTEKCMCMCMFMCIYGYMWVYVYFYVYVHVYVYVYVYMYLTGTFEKIANCFILYVYV